MKLPEHVIINLKTQEEFWDFIKRLNAKGYYRGGPGDLLDGFNPWPKYGEPFCIRLNGHNKIVNHDNKRYYETMYREWPVITLEEYYRRFDKEYLEEFLEAKNGITFKLIKAIKNVSRRKQ